LITLCAADGLFPSGQKDCALTFIAFSGVAFRPAYRYRGNAALPAHHCGLLFPAHPSPAEKTENLAADARQSQNRDRVTTTGGIRGVITSIKDDAIQLRIPPDNLRIEVVKSAIASVTQDEAK